MPTGRERVDYALISHGRFITPVTHTMRFARYSSNTRWTRSEHAVAGRAMLCVMGYRYTLEAAGRRRRRHGDTHEREVAACRRRVRRGGRTLADRRPAAR